MKITERIYARGEWVASSPLHTGGETDPFAAAADSMLLRGAAGNPLLSAASIAGVCRSYLTRRMQESARFRQGEEPAALHVLFGDDFQSLLIVEDAPATVSGSVTIRDGVRIDPVTGVAEDGKKYDFEILPAGTTLTLEFQLVLYEEIQGWKRKRFEEEGTAEREQEVKPEEIKSLFRMLLDALTQGEIAFGARTRRGLGHGKVERWELRRLDMTEPGAVAAWLDDPYSYPPCKPEDIADPDATDCRSCLEIDAYLTARSPLLVRSQRGGDVDFAHLVENGHAALPGASMAGAFRKRAEKIAHTIAGRGEKAKTLLESIFGYVREKDRDDPARAGRFRVTETCLAHGTDRLYVQGRVSIDRFTGAALESALFDEAAYWPNPDEQPLHVRFVLEDHKPHEAGLILLAAKDFWLDDLPVGGEIGVGRGRLRGTKLVIRDPQAVVEITAGSSGHVTSGDGAHLNEWVTALWQHLLPGEEQ